MHDWLGERIGYFPKNQEELEEMADARVPDEFILCRDANTYQVESRESRRQSVKQPQLPPWCPERRQGHRKEGCSGSNKRN